MQSNTIMQLAQLARGGGNPLQALQQIAGRDPRMSAAYTMLQGKSPQQLRSMAQNMAKERGVDIPALARQLGLM